MKSTLETRLGLFFALALVVSVVILTMIGSLDILQPGTKVTASFKTVHELKKGDQVKIAGVEVGRVEDIQLQNDLAVVTMKIQKKYVDRGAIKTDSTAIVKFSGLMGQNFISIQGGSPDSPPVKQGAVLTAKEQPDLAALMTDLQDVAGDIKGMANSFSPTNFSELLGPLTDFIKRNSPVLTATIGNMKIVSDKVAQGQGTVGRLINDVSFYNSVSVTMSNLQVASGDLKGLMHQTDDMVGKANAVMDDIKSGKGSLGLFATSDKFYNEATGAMTNFNQILGKINQGQGSVGKLVNDESFLKNAKLSLQKLDKATDSLEDQGPLSVLGIAIGTLF